MILSRRYDEWPVPVGPLCEMAYTPTQTYFRLWSPSARRVEVNLYEKGEGKARVLTPEGLPHVVALQRNGDGTHSGFAAGDLRGKFYTFSVFYEDSDEPLETQGIFAKAVGVNGKRAQILDMNDTHPEGWESDARPTFLEPQDAIIYELHLRDFTVGKGSGIKNRGKYLGLTERGTKNGDGLSTGLDHLVELGVTHVHLLPCFDFGSVDESKSDEPQYNWGYDPVNYNVPEGSYATNPYDPSVRIREFKEMVMALHRAGIRVVMDVVYNHVYDCKKSPFERTAPGYFFRWNEDGTPSNGSGCGNETASERPMMRKFMVESILHWVNEYHIDGFRFDLMGLHDMQTMNAIREAVNAVDPSIIIYGEGWTAAAPGCDGSLLAMKGHLGNELMRGIAAFGDELRDGLRGPWNDDRKGAFLTGRRGHEESVKFGLFGACHGVERKVDMKKVNYSSMPWATCPSQMICYVSCHDDLCLADRLKKTMLHGDSLSRLQKLAFAVVLASRGIPFIWCGDEVLRDRKGVRNCYKSPDGVNAIDFSLKTVHQDVFEYVRELIALRKTYRWQYEQSVRFLPVKGNNIIAAQYGKGILVVLNSSRRTISQVLPGGEWDVLSCSEGKASIARGVLKVPAQSAVFLKNQ